MITFTQDELMLMWLYGCAGPDGSGSRSALIRTLRDMQSRLTPHETDLDALTRSVLDKLNQMTETEFEQLDLYELLDEGGF